MNVVALFLRSYNRAKTRCYFFLSEQQVHIFTLSLARSSVCVLLDGDQLSIKFVAAMIKSEDVLAFNETLNFLAVKFRLAKVRSRADEVGLGDGWGQTEV